MSIFTALFSLTGYYQLFWAAPVNDQLNAPDAHALPWKGSCHFQWPLTSEVKASVTGEGGNHPERQSYLMCFVTSSGCLSRHLWLCVGSGAWECRPASVGCSPPASSSPWHLKVAEQLSSWRAPATQPVRADCQSAAPWSADLPAEPHRAAPLLHRELEYNYMIYSLCLSSNLSSFGNAALSLPLVSWGREKEGGNAARVHIEVIRHCFLSVF